MTSRLKVKAYPRKFIAIKKMNMKKRAMLALEDGTIFKGRSFGAAGETCGEAVFNTSLSGYQEILTDPSYKGQIVTMTNPLIGNYGVNPEDVEARSPFVEGFIVKECSGISSNWRSRLTLDEYLKKNNIIGIQGIDTRMLTKHLRVQGAMKGVISTEDADPESLIRKARDSMGLVGIDLVKEVTCGKPFEWNELKSNTKKYNVAVLDLGVKYNILRKLEEHNCRVAVYPAAATAEEILRQNPDGILLSNGPGDPEGIPYVVENVKKLIGRKPVFGICMGHHMITMALGGKMFKLKFGHHGGNHPVKDLKTGKISVSVQNHGFCCDINSLGKDKIEITHINLNDNTLEGIRHRELPLFSVQFHPEASPGPHDTGYLFDDFVRMMEEYR